VDEGDAGVVFEEEDGIGEVVLGVAECMELLLLIGES
jgi:hypothetical protein